MCTSYLKFGAIYFHFIRYKPDKIIVLGVYNASWKVLIKGGYFSFTNYGFTSDNLFSSKAARLL